MAFFERSARTERELKWARIWFNQFAAFHQHQGEPDWTFSAEDVIAFSRFKLNKGMPAWKRLKMVQSLMNFRTQVQKRPTDDLIPIHRKLQEIVARERVKESGAESIEEVVGKINPRESEVIQQYRRKLRLMGKKYATERAYVGKVKAFMRERGLRCMADFANIGGQDVERFMKTGPCDHRRRRDSIALSHRNRSGRLSSPLLQPVLPRAVESYRQHGRAAGTPLAE